MRRVDLVTVGDAFEDLVFVGLPRLPRAGEELKTPTLVRTIGGGAVITAIAAARLGVSSAVVTAVGASGEQRLREEGVKLINLRRPGEPAAVSAALSTPRDRSFVTFTGVNDRLEPRFERALARVRARHVHLAFQPSDCRRWLPIVGRLRAGGMTTSWDFGWSERLAGDPMLGALAAELDVLFLNALEAKLYRGVAGRTTVVKLGPKGARWSAGGRVVALTAPRVTVVDTTGAGDAFDGGFLAARLAGGSPRDWLRAGNRVGARSTEAAGGLDGLLRLK